MGYLNPKFPNFDLDMTLNFRALQFDITVETYSSKNIQWFKTKIVYFDENCYYYFYCTTLT